uniref:C-type lectin domain-containing protein n=2 Tax=Oreochromis TaxID=8139 RepID=A0A669CWN0_ORENI
KKTFLFFSGGLPTLPPHSREYHFVNQMMNWTEAQSYCREHFTDLVTIYNSNINQLLLSMAANIDYVWIGLYRDPWAPWSDNTTSTFTNWAPSDPNNYASAEYCGALNLMSGKWDDGFMKISSYFVENNASM